MPSKIALVAFDRCRAQECEDGKCAAAAACTKKLLKQEAPYEPPMPHPSLCRACADCVRACPFDAIKIVNV